MLLVSGCSGRKSARAHPIQSPQQLEEKLTRAIGKSDALADGDKKKPDTPKKEEEADINQRLRLTLDAKTVARGGSLSGTVSGGFGDDIVRVLWVDGVGRVISVAEVRPPKEKENVAQFEMPLPSDAVGSQHRAVLVSATRDAGKKAAKNGDDPFQVQAEAAFSVSPAASEGFGGYCVFSDRPFGSIQHAPSLRHGGLAPAQGAGIATALPPETHPLLMAEPFSEKTLQDIAGHLQNSTQKTKAPLAWSLFDWTPADAGRFADVEHDDSRNEIFQSWLSDRYGKLSALNTYWGTAYRAWGEIIPPLTDETKAANNAAYAQKWQAADEGMEADAEPKEQKQPAEKPEPADADFTLEPGELRTPGGENFAAWCDARSFDDFTFARLLREYRSRLHAIEPGALCGIGSAQAPSAWGGWDWFQVARSVDWLEANAPSYAASLSRSFNPELKLISRTTAQTPGDIYALWSRWLSGDSGCVIVAPEAPAHVPEKSRPLSKATADLEELTSGLTLLRNQGKIREDAIALWYSPRSIQLHWLLDSEGDGANWRQRNAETDLRQSSAHLQFQAWTLLLEDLGYSPRFIHPQQALSGALDVRTLRVLVLPKVLSLSDAEARAIRNFANSGGLVIADGACGTFDGVGRRRMLLREEHPAGALDADFGIARGDLIVQERNGTFSGDAEASRVVLRDRVSGQPFGPESNELRVMEPGITLMGAQSHARAKGVEGKRGAAALATRRSGLGRFVYLNLSLQDYPVLRALPSDETFQYHGLTRDEYTKKYGQASGGEALRLIVSDMLAESLGENPLKVRNEAGVPLRGIRRTTFDLGNGAELIGLLPRASVSTGTNLEISGQAFTDPVSAWAGTGMPRHWYDQHTGTYLGHVPMARVTLEPHRATMLSALPYAVEKLIVKARRLDERGIFKLSAAIQASGGEATTHVFHVEVASPSGKPLPHLARNVVAPKGQWSGTIVLGLNEEPGAYKATIRDVLTGRRTEAELLKEASEYSKCVPARESAPTKK